MTRDGRSAGKSEPFIMLARPFLQRPVFRRLPGDAKSVLLAAWSHYAGPNTLPIPLPVIATAALLGLGRDAVTRSINLLLALGLIRCTREAARLGRKARQFVLSEEFFTSEAGGCIKPDRSARGLSEAEVDAIVARHFPPRRNPPKAEPPPQKPPTRKRRRPSLRVVRNGH